jgi:hypothetical protein
MSCPPRKLPFNVTRIPSSASAPKEKVRLRFWRHRSFTRGEVPSRDGIGGLAALPNLERGEPAQVAKVESQLLSLGIGNALPFARALATRGDSIPRHVL